MYESSQGIGPSIRKDLALLHSYRRHCHCARRLLLPHPRSLTPSSSLSFLHRPPSSLPHPSSLPPSHPRSCLILLPSTLAPSLISSPSRGCRASSPPPQQRRVARRAAGAVEGPARAWRSGCGSSRSSRLGSVSSSSSRTGCGSSSSSRLGSVKLG